MSHDLRIAHLSDFHFSHITYSLEQYFSKRWLGNWNLILFRNRRYQTEHLNHIPELLEKLEVNAACITGDFSSTSFDKEFVDSLEYIKKFPMPVHVLPGNHDCYTKEAERNKIFYNFLGSEELKTHRVEKSFLGNGWWWIGLDCTVATPPFYSNGKFFEGMEKPLEEAIQAVPSQDNIVIGNHFPLYRSKGISHDLARLDVLQNILKKYPQVKLYLHGHDHKPYIVDKTLEGLPLVLNAGSCAHRPNGTFFIIDLFDKECLVQQLFYIKGEEAFTWVVKWQKHYNFRTK